MLYCHFLVISLPSDHNSTHRVLALLKSNNMKALRSSMLLGYMAIGVGALALAAMAIFTLIMFSNFAI